MNIKKSLGVLTCLFVFLALASPASAQLKVFGSYWNTTEVDETFGGGVSFGVPIGESGFGLHFRGTYYQELTDEPLENLFEDDNQGFFAEESLEVLPLEVGVHYNFAPRGTFSPYIGGGATYFMIDTTREGVDVDDETGFHAEIGSQFGDPDGLNFFAEAIYRSTEATLVRERRQNNIDLRDEVALDLDGVAVNAGFVWRW